jgi:stage V sporulation protein S
VRDASEVELHAIGPQAVNQAVKGIAAARGWLAAEGILIAFRPSFRNVTDDNTAIRLTVGVDTA